MKPYILIILVLSSVFTTKSKLNRKNKESVFNYFRLKQAQNIIQNQIKYNKQYNNEGDKT